MTPDVSAPGLERRRVALHDYTLRQFRRAGDDAVSRALLSAILEYRLGTLARLPNRLGGEEGCIAPPLCNSATTTISEEGQGVGVDAASPSPLTLPTVLADLGLLPALSEVVMDLLNYLEHPDVDGNQVAQKIARDPGLCAKLLSVANSSFYGLQGQVETISDALVVLGLRAVRTLVTATAVVSHLQALAGRQQRAFWVHSAGTALCARALARRVGTNAEAAFTAGLLHDLGRLILAARFADQYRAVVDYRVEHDIYVIEAEHQVLGFDHTEVGAALAQRWKFPVDTVAAIACHHTPTDQPAGSLAGLIHVADAMAHALGFVGDEEDLMPRLSGVVWTRLGLSWDEFQRLLGEVDAQRDEAEWVLD